MTDKLYEEKKWKGKTLLICPLCGADSFEKIVMLRHLVNKHDSELALVQLVELEGNPTLNSSPIAKENEPHLERGDSDVFEVELVETGSAVDAQGNEHKTYKVKEQ